MKGQHAEALGSSVARAFGTISVKQQRGGQGHTRVSVSQPNHHPRVTRQHYPATLDVSGSFLGLPSFGFVQAGCEDSFPRENVKIGVDIQGRRNYTCINNGTNE